MAMQRPVVQPTTGFLDISVISHRPRSGEGKRVSVELHTQVFKDSAT